MLKILKATTRASSLRPTPRVSKRFNSGLRTAVVQETGSGLYQNSVEVNGHKFLVDEPTSEGGTNTGPSPYEYLIGALGSCTTITCRMYAERKKIPLSKVTCKVTHQKIEPSQNDGKTDKFTRELTFNGDLSPEQTERLLTIAGHCPVHRALSEGKNIVETVHVK